MYRTWYLNGKWVAGTPFLTADDAGMVFGAVVTDRLRTFRHKPYQLDEHFARFRNSGALAHVPIELSIQQFAEIVDQLLEQNEIWLESSRDCAIVMLATPGPVDGQGPPTLIVHAAPLDFARYRNMFQRGAQLAITTTTRQIVPSVFTPNIKHRSRLNWWIARQEVQGHHSSADALLLDDAGYITETASANVIVVKDGVLFTPPLESVLPGLSLQTVREMCAADGLTFQEHKLKPEDCYSADEIFLTCTSWCMAGVSQLNGRPIPWPGPVYQRFSNLWSERIGMDYVAQILEANN